MAALNRGPTRAAVLAEQRDASTPSLGFIEQVTTHTSSTGSRAQMLRKLNKSRRLRRMRHCVAAHADSTRDTLTQGGFRYYAAFVTLTYEDVDGYRPEHVTAYLNSLRNLAQREGWKLHYEWVLELQKRGAPHYHLLIWIPEGKMIPKPDHGMWKHGHSQIARARNGVGYLVKYATKGDNEVHPMPHGARLFGTGGDAAARLARHRAGLPRWLVEKIAVGARAKRIPFVGWMCEATGEIYRSPYVMRWRYDEHGNAVVDVIKYQAGETSFAKTPGRIGLLGRMQCT